MKYIHTIILFVIFGISGSIAQINEGTLFIKNITIVTSNESDIIQLTGNVFIEGDKISYVGAELPDWSEATRVFDGTGKYLIPGLIDSHVHLASISGLNAPLKKKYPDLVDHYYDQLPKSYLYFGYTTLIDLNNYSPSLLKKLRDLKIRPEIYSCGEQVIVMDDFHMEMEAYTLDQRYTSNFLNDIYNKNITFPDSIDVSEHTPQRIVSKIRDQKGVCIKLVYEDEASGLAVSWQKPSERIIQDLVSAGLDYSMPLILHAPSLEGHQFGMKVGANIFAHGMWNWSENPEKFNDQELGNLHKEVLHEISSKQIPYQITFRTIAGEKDLIEMDFLKDKELEHVFPSKFIDLLKSEEGQWGKRKIFNRTEFLEKTNPPFYRALKGDFTDETLMWQHVFKVYSHRLNTITKFLGDNDANLILGSDTPAMNMYTNPPGYNGYLEMQHLSDAGISTEQIFNAATFNNAKAFNLGHLYGTVEKGKIANLLILDSNPLDSVDAYNQIEWVIIRGTMIKRSDLSAINKQ